MVPCTGGGYWTRPLRSSMNPDYSLHPNRPVTFLSLPFGLNPRAIEALSRPQSASWSLLVVGSRNRRLKANPQSDGIVLEMVLELWAPYHGMAYWIDRDEQRRERLCAVFQAISCFLGKSRKAQASCPQCGILSSWILFLCI